MKHKLIWIIGIILLTNLITFLIVKFYFPTTINNNHFLLKMKGKGENWEISDYQFAWESDKGAIQGSEIVTYLGNPMDITGEIVVEIYDYFKNGSVPHQTYKTQAENLKDGSFEAGGGGAYPDNDLSVGEIVSTTEILIRWTTNDGMEHEETIQMELDYSPQILSHIE